MYTLPYSQEILYTTPSCFRGSTGSLGRTKCDLSVVSDLKAGRMPCCCRQRRSGSDKPLMYGKTAVDLSLVAGSLSDACRILDFVVLVTNEYGYPFETRTEVKSFFFLRGSQWFSDDFFLLIVQEVNNTAFN